MRARSTSWPSFLRMSRRKRIWKPESVRIGTEISPDAQHPNAPLFAEVFYRAIGRAAGHLDLAMRVLRLIAEAVDVRGALEQSPGGRLAARLRL